ncbi:DUF1430 domain-containing protein [Shouchella miscanthi]|uniref:DUF1430 domain-containing protein n=1 Tax=Shouchella miscanthi TaxID=2598861 RepID=A0ABU6NI74_9BACI|nr:DUF1430 domain-containing protein [Shouchella miscanthi]MED4127726.1 DUF1430 domain-containing protein [Shouchella miscanthi]
MKKALSFLLILVFFLSTYLFAGLLEEYKFDTLLYKDRSAVAFNFSDYEEDANELLQQAAREYNVSISKYVFIDPETARIFTTDVTLNNRINLLEGIFPEQGSKQFITTEETSNNSSGYFQSGNRNVSLDVYHLESQRQAAASGIYYLEGDRTESIMQVIAYMESNGVFAEVMELHISPVVIEEPLAFSLTPLAIFLTALGIVAFYFMNRSGEIILLKVNGYSYRKVVFTYAKKLAPALLIAAVIGYSLFNAASFLVNGYVTNFLSLLGYYLILFAIVVSMILLFSSLLLVFFYFFVNNYQALKGKKPYSALMAISFVLKTGFLLAVLFSLAQLNSTHSSLKEYQNNLQIWDQTENLYRTNLMSTGSVSLETEYEQNQNLKNVYSDLNERLNGFIMDASNYELMGDGRYLYEANTEGERTETNPSGKTITINENYLNYNPIEAVEGTVENQFIDEEKTLNLLVPQSLERYEEEIKDNFQNYFYFQAVEVENIYNEARNSEENTTPLEAYNIEIIYVKDGQKYFTFNPEYEGSSEYYVENPIAIVDNGQFDSSYYMSYLSRIYYFFTEDENPLGELDTIAAENNASAQINSIESIYDTYGQTIQQLITTQYFLLVAIILLFIGVFTMSIYYTLCYFYKNSMKILMQKIHGFTLLKSHKYLFLLHLFVYILLLIVAVSLEQSLLFIILLLGLLLDTLLTVFLSKRYEKIMHVKLKKEGQL